MSSAFEKLGRILQLELEQGCRNRAVIGGLERFLVFWQKQALEEVSAGAPTASLRIEEVLEALQGYAEKPTAVRREVVAALLAALSSRGETASESAPSPGEPEAPPPIQATAPAEEAPLPAVFPTQEEAPIALEPARVLDLFDVPVTALYGVSTAYQRRLARLGLKTVGDVLYHLPRRYDDYAHLKTINRLNWGEEVTVVGVVRRVETQRGRSGIPIIRVTVSDGTGAIECVWFNQPYLTKSLKTGREIVISGKVDEYLGSLVFTSPEWEPLRRDLLHTGRLVPVYPLTEGVTGRWMRRLVRTAISEWADRLRDYLPPSVREDAGLIGLQKAIRQVHFPDDLPSLEAARRRLCFDELFLLQLGVLSRRHMWRTQEGYALRIPQEKVEQFITSLPFTLTGAQQRAILAILEDLQRPVPMSRLLQGDVGSGKTVVAVAAMLVAAWNGYQAALMAPTSVLAEQHHRTLQQLLAPFPEIRCELLMGSLSNSEKARLHQEIAEGRIHLVVGTHALIQKTVTFQRLGLAVVDEQHRFGVMQRGALSAKGGEAQPHILVMSATPIPRTLALTMYGDLDISVLDELPPKRQTIVTAVRDRRSRERIYSFIEGQVAQGRQAFIICPLVEESERVDAKAAVAEHKRLQEEVFPHLRVGLLHGRMKAEEKEEVMAAFKRGEYDILVSTAVVEVGIDVPNATVILIEGAERFGLAQLHQFRGRVGRGEHKSYCILLTEDPSEESMERLTIMEETTDGFALAEKDLEMRGPGDFLGIRQHGLPQLRVAQLSDTAVLQLAREQALILFERDPQLAKPEHIPLAEAVSRFWRGVELS